MEVFIVELDVANLCPSVPTKVKLLLASIDVILKYKPFKKYLVSSLEIANLVLLIRFSKVLGLTFIFVAFEVLVSIIGNSSFGRQDKENFETFDLIVSIFPSFDINSISLVSGNFLIISNII